RVLTVHFIRFFVVCFFFFFQAEDGIRDRNVTGVQTCALPISLRDEFCPTPAPRRPTALLGRSDPSRVERQITEMRTNHVWRPLSVHSHLRPAPENPGQPCRSGTLRRLVHYDSSHNGCGGPHLDELFGG